MEKIRYGWGTDDYSGSGAIVSGFKTMVLSSIWMKYLNINILFIVDLTNSM